MMGRIVLGDGMGEGDGTALLKEESLLDWKDIGMDGESEVVGWLAQKKAE